MNIKTSHSKQSTYADRSDQLPLGKIFDEYQPTLCRTIRRKHFQVQDLVTLQTYVNAPSAFFQKRDRSLKNPTYSILSFDASITVSITDNIATVVSTTENIRTDQSAVHIAPNTRGIERTDKMRLSGCPFDYLNSILEAQTNIIDYQSLPTEISFASGMIGYLGFGITSQIEHIEKQKNNPFNVPDSMMMLPQTIVFIDHQNDSIHVISRSRSERFSSIINLVERLNETASQAHHGSSGRGQLRDVERKTNSQNQSKLTPELNDGDTVKVPTKSQLSASMSRQDFVAKASKAKQLIAEGQCFQIVLSQRFSAATSVSAAQMFSTLLETAPSTYNYFFNFPDFQYIGASPETMISAKAGQVRLCALAGTRPRGRTPAQDDLNEVELKTNEKELAEHLMLVDLGRNDLGKVCAPGTIQVGPIAQVLKYSNVMHLGTEIFGTLEQENTPLEALKACFPRGTVSGAPKVRALELLSKLEPEQRGIYAGAVGFFDGRGSMDTAIAIRSALLKDGFIHINAGAGIVYDSEPEFEYMETINKASAMTNVFQNVKSATSESAAKPGSAAILVASADDQEAGQVTNIRAGAR